MSLISEHFVGSLPLGRGEMSSSGEDKDMSGDGVVGSLADEGESHRPGDEPLRSESPRDESVKYLGPIRKEWRRILPRLPDLTMLRLLGEKSQTP